jgi:hypothetical protein
MSREDLDLQRLERLAARMDSAFRVPGTGIRVGYDSIVGLIPGIGDTLAAIPAAYIIYEGRRLGVSNGVLGRMIANAGVDYVIGLIPLVGDRFDAGFKANRRNVALVRRDLERKGRVAKLDPGARTPEPRSPLAYDRA